MKLIGLLLACGLACLASDNDTFFIHDVDVYPVTAKEMKSVSVLIENGKIVDIGAKLVPPKGIRIVEGKGKRLYPGMIDSGTNLGLSEISAVRESVDTGEVGEFMPQLRALVAVNPSSEHIGVIRVNGITTVLTYPGGAGGGRGAGGRQLISGQAGLMHLDGWTWEEMEINRGAALQINFPALGNRGGRRGGGGDVPDATGDAAGAGNARRAFDEAVNQLSEFFESARRYKTAKAANMPGFRTDLKLEAMLPILDGKEPAAVVAQNAETIHEAILWADKQHIRIVILEPREGGKAVAELKAKNIPVVLGRVLALPERPDDAYDQAFTLATEFYKGGVKFAFGTFDNEFVRNLPYNAATAVAFGLPYDEALKAITINPAEIWGVSDRIGSIEKGKWADVLLTDGDPLEMTTKISRIYIKGKEVDLTNKQVRLYEKYSSRQ
jgi:imidazolonepropionase-like amidohydrolase